MVSLVALACDVNDGGTTPPDSAERRPQRDEYVGLGFFRSELPKSTGFAPLSQRTGRASAPVLIVGTLGGIVFDKDGDVWRDTRPSIAAPRQDVLVGRVEALAFARTQALIPGAARAPFLAVPNDECRDCSIDYIKAYSSTDQALVELATVGEKVRRRDSEDAETLFKWILAVQRDIDVVAAGRVRQK